MTLYFKGDRLIAKLNISAAGADLDKIDAIMARDGLKRCTRKEYAQAQIALDDKSPEQPFFPEPATAAGN